MLTALPVEQPLWPSTQRTPFPSAPLRGACSPSPSPAVQPAAGAWQHGMSPARHLRSAPGVLWVLSCCSLGPVPPPAGPDSHPTPTPLACSALTSPSWSTSSTPRGPLRMRCAPRRPSAPACRRAAASLTPPPSMPRLPLLRLPTHLPMRPRCMRSSSSTQSCWWPRRRASPRVGVRPPCVPGDVRLPVANCPALCLHLFTRPGPPSPSLPSRPPACPAEEHRELVRRCLRTMLAAGYSPLSFFARDISKYFYLAELLSLVDLSLVRQAAAAAWLVPRRAGSATCAPLGPWRAHLSGKCVSARLRNDCWCGGFPCPPHADGEAGCAVQSLGRLHPQPGHRAAPQEVRTRRGCMHAAGWVRLRLSAAQHRNTRFQGSLAPPGCLCCRYFDAIDRFQAPGGYMGRGQMGLVGSPGSHHRCGLPCMLSRTALPCLPRLASTQPRRLLCDDGAEARQQRGGAADRGDP